MTPVAQLWNMMFSNEETGHPLSLVLCKGKRRFHLTCQSLEDWDLQCVQRSMLIMLWTQSQDAPGRDFWSI